MSLLEDKIAYIKTMLAEWKLSAEEEAKLLPDNPTEDDCDNLYVLKANLTMVRLTKDGFDLPEEDHIQFQSDWLRANIPPLDGKTPLDFVNGNTNRLAELVFKMQGPLPQMPSS